MTPKIAFLSEKKLIGKRLKMSLIDNKTGQLWGSFMPHRKEILNALNTDLISMQIYDNPLYFNELNSHAIFEKWATVNFWVGSNVAKSDGYKYFVSR